MAQNFEFPSISEGVKPHRGGLLITISGGAWKGRKLKVIETEGLRPTSGRVKESIFSIIESLLWKRRGSPSFEGLRVLDLFAGVGGLGFEAMSRGASSCLFVEKERRQGKILQENSLTLNCQEDIEIYLEDVSKGSWKKKGPFGLVLLDPPYVLSQMDKLLAELGSCEAVENGAIILFEHDPKVHLGVPASLSLHSRRELGPAGISVFLKNPLGD